MIIISDTSPLHLLIQVGQVQVLPALFTHVVIPPEVAAELSHSNTPASVQTFMATPPPWLSVQQPSTLLPLPALHPGETAAISLAVELSALLLIDERDGRAEARSRGVRIIGAVGALEQAANAGFIADLATVHNQIRALRFHVSDAILQASLARHLANATGKKGSP